GRLLAHEARKELGVDRAHARRPQRVLLEELGESGDDGAPVRPCSSTYAVSLNSSRPISMRRISDVPAPISYSFASRHRRPVGNSLMYPLAPRHCIASPAIHVAF